MKQISSILILFLIIFQSYAGTTKMQTMRGLVTDKDSKIPLIGVAVFVISGTTKTGTITNFDGEFIFNDLPIGTYNVEMSYLGYKPLNLQNVNLVSGKQTVLTIDLEESVAELADVEIRANNATVNSQNELNLVSTRTFSVEETGRYAGSKNDVSRMASNYAGVATGNDSRNDIVIRGNSPSGLLWRLDGLDIPSPNHFSGVGSNGGPISMLNYNVIANSDFLTGAFPAEYGNGLSGVFDIKMRNGNTKDREYMVQLGTLGMEFMLEGPFSKKSNASYIINGRMATTTIMTALGINFGYPGKADYKDLSYKVYLPTKNLGVVSLFGLLGNSIYKVDYEQKSKDDFNENITENTDDNYETALGIVGLSHMIHLNNNSYVKTVLGYTIIDESGKIDSVDVLSDRKTPYYRTNNQNGKYYAHSFMKTKLSARSKIKTGFILDFKNFTINEEMYNQVTEGLEEYRYGNNTTTLLQAYTQWKYTPLENVTVNTGLHFQYLTLNGSKSLEPRIGVKYDVNEKQNVTLGYGLHSQMQLLPVYFVSTENENGIMERTNENLDFSKSHHFVVSYTNGLGKDLALKLETYYQYLFDIPVNNRSTPTSYSLINAGSGYWTPDEANLVNEGTGYNYGLEITLEKSFSRSYYFLLTGSLFDSKYQGSDEVLRNTAYNGNYIANLLIGKEFNFSRNRAFVVDLKTTWAGGRRFTPIDEALSKQYGVVVELDDRAYSKQQKDYFRTDFKIAYKKNAKKSTHELFINIDNVFNNKNIFTQVYSSETNSIENVYQLGVFPTLQYKVQF